MSDNKINEEHKQLENNIQASRLIDPEELEKIFNEMILNQESLKNGFNTLNKFETQRNFHLGVLTNIFKNLDDERFKKLACSAFNIYIRNNWNMNHFITNEEKLVLI